MRINATHNYNDGNTRPSIDATVLPLEMRRDQEKAKKELEAHVAASEEYKRVPKGTRAVVTPLPEEETYMEDGSKITTKPTTTTKRTDR